MAEQVQIAECSAAEFGAALTLLESGAITKRQLFALGLIVKGNSSAKYRVLQRTPRGALRVVGDNSHHRITTRGLVVYVS